MHHAVRTGLALSLFILPPLLSADQPTFHRGVNLAGPAVTIDGHTWDGDKAAGIVCDDRALVLTEHLQLEPPTDEARATMLHAFRWNRRAHVRFPNIAAGVYTIWLYVVEDNNPEEFDIFIADMLAVRHYNSGPQGTWRRIGPMVVEVTDGGLDLTTRGGAANLCGIEIWKGAAAGAEPLSPPKAPVSPFVGQFADRKPRVVVMTDIGGDPDDRQSLVRYLLYTCDLDTEAFCTGFGWGHRKQTRPDLIHKALDAYGGVVANLRKHRGDYPAVDALRALVKDGHNGNPDAVGPGMDSEASNAIIAILDKDDPRPVWFTVWGGPRELAQALWKLQQTRAPDDLVRLKAKIRVHSIADQDGTAKWIKEHHPDVFYLYSHDLFRGIWKYGDQNIVSPDWLKRHVLTGHGPLGDPEIYPPVAAGKKGVKEGDTPSYFWVLRNGLGDPEAPTWGNWGGRFRYSGAGSAFLPTQDVRNGKGDMYYTIWRWRTAYQNEFEARMDWCVKPYDQANHAPVAVCDGTGGVGTVMLNATPGTRVALSAAGSRDPDGDTIAHHWWVYREAGTCGADVTVENAASARASLTVPAAAAAGQTIHVILEVTDDGTPALTAYRRIVITVAADG